MSIDGAILSHGEAVDAQDTEYVCMIYVSLRVEVVVEVDHVYAVMNPSTHKK